jgi:rare lipoprotein A
MLDAPLGSRVSILNPSNQRRSWCIVTDRGPYVGGRIIDVTPTVSKELGFYVKGIAKLVLRIFVHKTKKAPDEMPTF